MLRNWFFILSLMFPVLCKAAWASMNIDTKTMEAMTLAYATEFATESMNDESMQKILDHYSSAEIATAGIFASKWLDRKALQNAGLFDNAQENFYYRRIYTMVSARIMPKILDVASLMIKYPEKAMYWGPYLFKICEQTKQLCMIFETVVTNSTLTFQDIAFLAINDNLKDLFDLTKFGSVDWRAVWDHLADFGSGITKEDLIEDLEGLMNAGSAIASAGGSILNDAWMNGSKVGGIFHMKPGEILELYRNFKDMYITFSDPVNIKNLVMAKIISTDSIGVANLFTLDGYNITSYVSDYIKQMQGQYYTQRWYIYEENSGSETVCSWCPYEPNVSRNGWLEAATFPDLPDYVYSGDGFWTIDGKLKYIESGYRRDYINAYDSKYRNYKIDASIKEAAKGYAATAAGYSYETINSLNSQGNGEKYTISFDTYQERIVEKEVRWTGWGSEIVSYVPSSKLCSWCVRVTRSWNNKNVVYEEVFDNQYDSERAIQARFNAKLSELNCNENGKVYLLGKDDKHYYNAADEAKMKGCATVSFAKECHDSNKLAEGNFSWKENGDQRNALDENSKRFAMETTLPGTPKTQEADDKIQELTDKVNSFNSQIKQLKDENKALLSAISNSSVEEAEGLREQYNANQNKISSLQSELNTTQQQLNEWNSYKQDIEDDYADERDGEYRIPAVMHELEAAYKIQWADEGEWVGYTFIRHGNFPNINGVVEFRADLTKERGESHNWLIGRYHRAILAVSWALIGNTDSSEIIEYMDIDPSLSDKDKATQVNERLHQLQMDYPDCEIEANYAYTSPPNVDEDPDAVHLLWVCDRLKVARDVDYKLSKIYAQLVLVEKFMRNRETLLVYLKRAMGLTQMTSYGRGNLGRKSFKRWRTSATAAATGETAESVVARMNEEE